MRNGIRKEWDDLNFEAESFYRKYEYRKKAKLRLRQMNGGCKYTKEYGEIVILFWKKYGLRPDKIWYQIFWDRAHEPDLRYIPDDLWYGVIVPYFSNSQFHRFDEDKYLHDVFFKDLVRPETIVKNVAGIFYGAHMYMITKEQAIEKCMVYQGESLIKLSIDSGEGRLISFFDSQDLGQKSLVSAIDGLKANFIAQKAVERHAVLVALNPSSLNTICVMSFLPEGTICILSSILRMGASGHKVDSTGASGFACPIRANGWLTEKGVNREVEWAAENQHGIRFTDAIVPSYDKIIAMMKKQYLKLAYFKLIGWDFSTNVKGEPVFVEYNVCPGSNQITCGPTFGDLAERVLEEVFAKETLEYAQN